MFEIFGNEYYIDIDNITEKCRIKRNITLIEENNESDEEKDNENEIDENIVELTNESSIEINLFKYEIIKMCIDRVLDDISQVDEEMGKLGANEVSPSFKLAFNTLLKNEIILENNE